jgi:DNA end-binding protein Ku
MATIWKGAISFGLVNIPVELVAAVRADHISFRMLDATSKTPIKYERVRASDGKEVPWKEIVKGYEYAKGEFIILTDEDFKKAELEASRSIDILDFVPASEIDPRFFETPYFVVPAKGGERPYALLRESMRGMDVVGVGKIIMRQHQHLAGIHVVGDALVLELMRFATEVVDAERYAFPPASAVREQERLIAVQLINSLLGTFAPDKYTDDYRANLQRIIKAKAKGKDISLDVAPANAVDADVLDLMTRLKESLQAKPLAKRGAKTSASKSTSRTSGESNLSKPRVAKATVVHKSARKSAGRIAGSIPSKKAPRRSA